MAALALGSLRVIPMDQAAPAQFGMIATSTVSGILYEGDTTTIARLFNAYVACMAAEYMLDEKEVAMLTEELNRISPSEFKNLFATPPITEPVRLAMLHTYWAPVIFLLARL